MSPESLFGIERIAWEQEQDREKARAILCHNCGWNALFEMHTLYTGKIKCVYACASRGVWQLGTDYILKEQPVWERLRGSRPDLGTATVNYVRENTTIPVPAEAICWQDEHSHFSLMKRIPGESLKEVWFRLSTEEKKSCAREVVEYLVQLRTLTASSPQTIDGAPVRNVLLADFKPVVTLEDKAAWWAQVEKYFRGGIDRGERLRALHPGHAAPYVLTHGDLNTGNIMICDGHVSGIIDWDTAGYYPDWWESVVAFANIEEGEWQYYLRSEMKTQFGIPTEAVRFWNEFWCNVYKNKSDPDEIAYRAAHEAVLAAWEKRGDFCDCKPYWGRTAQ
ncbi:hypothetical protein MMC09_006249 [Bachmanniomyces sp. S44760]|nr:hypothetical protein [Bachmanniomyces sp. S44760]